MLQERERILFSIFPLKSFHPRSRDVFRAQPGSRSKESEKIIKRRPGSMGGLDKDV